MEISKALQNAIREAGKVRADYVRLRAESERNPCNCGDRSYCEDCYHFLGIVKKLEKAGWRCCETCGEFDVEPSAEVDVCHACGDDQAVA